MKDITFDDKEIRERLKGKLAKLGKSDKFQTFIDSKTVDGVSILTMMSRILDILATQEFDIQIIESYRRIIEHLQTRENPSKFRDIARGLFYELFKDIQGSSNKATIGKALDSAVSKDIVMNMLLITKEEAERVNEATRTNERNLFKQRMRELDDATRQIYKKLLDAGVSSYIVSEEDRIVFAREYQQTNPEKEYEEEAAIYDMDRPEDGYNNTPGLIDDKDRPQNVFGEYMDMDNGDYGELARNNEYVDDTVGDFSGETGV
jgi:hypothetical protein